MSVLETSKTRKKVQFFCFFTSEDAFWSLFGYQRQKIVRNQVKTKSMVFRTSRKDKKLKSSLFYSHFISLWPALIVFFIKLEFFSWNLFLSLWKFLCNDQIRPISRTREVGEHWSKLKSQGKTRCRQNKGLYEYKNYFDLFFNK